MLINVSGILSLFLIAFIIHFFCNFSIIGFTSVICLPAGKISFNKLTAFEEVEMLGVCSIA